MVSEWDCGHVEIDQGEPHECDGRDVCSAERHPYVDIDRLGFNGLMRIAQRLLDEHYPATVPLLCDRDSPDPGARLTAALRDCMEAMQRASPEQEGAR